MGLKLTLASLSVLGVLSGFVVAILLVISYLGGNFSWPFMIGITILFNLIMWLLSPIIQDLIYKFVYGVEFHNLEDLAGKKKYFLSLKKLCDRHNVRYPRVGVIDDLNPTAFTYGSTKNNARIIFTRGLEHFLDEEEIEAVLAHELGHVVHRDFIFMTIASTIIQLLYEAFSISLRLSMFGGNKNNDENKNGGAYWIVVAIISYVFYVIGTYMVLFLSRIREYYADEFSAKETKNPNALSYALLKIAYGITQIPKDPKVKGKIKSQLLSSTNALGIFDVNSANEIGMSYSNSKKGGKEIISQTLLYDVINPWAGFMELSSTHPLIGKRIMRLDRLSSKPVVDFGSLKSNVNTKKLWENFFTDFFVTKVPTLLFLGAVVVGLMNMVFKLNILFYAWILFIGYSVMAIFRLNYMYSRAVFHDATTANLMTDLYASPVRGKPIVLKGAVIGRGEPGLVISEDMMYQDKTGIIFLNYESNIPIIGNWLFGAKEHSELHGVDSTIRGWFFRGAGHYVDLLDYNSSKKHIKSAVRFWAGFWMVAKIIILAVIVALL